MVKGNPVCAKPMMKSAFLKPYAGLSTVSHVCTHEIKFQVVYAYFHSKFTKPGVFTMVLAHSIEHFDPVQDYYQRLSGFWLLVLAMMWFWPMVLIKVKSYIRRRNS